MTGSRFGSLGGSITGTLFDFRNVDIRFHHTQLPPSRFSDITVWVTIIAFLVQNEWTISHSVSITGAQFDYLITRLLENNLHTDDIYKKHNIPKIHQQIQLENAKLWHRQQTNTLPSKLQRIMTLDHSNSDLHRQHRYSTRNKTLPRQPIARCHQYQNSLFVKGLADFAILPLELRKIKNRTTFISKVKDHILKC